MQGGTGRSPLASVWSDYGRKWNPGILCDHSREGSGGRIQVFYPLRGTKTRSCGLCAQCGVPGSGGSVCRRPCPGPGRPCSVAGNRSARRPGRINPSGKSFARFVLGFFCGRIRLICSQACSGIVPGLWKIALHRAIFKKHDADGSAGAQKSAGDQGQRPCRIFRPYNRC